MITLRPCSHCACKVLIRGAYFSVPAAVPNTHLNHLLLLLLPLWPIMVTSQSSLSGCS